MKKIHILLAVLMTTAPLLTSCSDDEDTSPSNVEVNGFAPAANDNSATAQLQREFFNETGVYLLFSDTLTAVNGQQPELLDLGWTISGSYGYKYTFKYITDIDAQRKAADGLKHSLLTRLGKSKPFSVLLADDIAYESYGRLRHSTNVLGVRCYAFNLDDGEELEDIDGFFSGMFLTIVKDVLDRNSDKLDPFYAFSEEYYGEDLDYFGWDSLTEQETWDLGFFRYYSSWGVYFPYKSGDLSDWLNAVTSMSREEFEATYGSSATMMNKFETLVGIIESLGIEL
ncbi:MAG: hypothetical protein ACI4B3_01000 [Prevotella sp.]